MKFYHHTKYKKDTNLNKTIFFSENMFGTFCATCRATGYPCFHMKFFFQWFLSLKVGREFKFEYVDMVTRTSNEMRNIPY